jgi:hypothetical protein
VFSQTPRRDTTHGKARDRAAERVGVGWQKAERAAAVVQAMDYLQDRGKAREAAELRQTLNGTSVQRAYEQAVDAGYVERPALRAASRLSRRCHTTIDEQRMQNATIDALLPRLRWAELEQLLFFAVEEGLSVKSLWRLCRERQQARQDEANRQDIGTDGVDAGAAQSGRSRDNKEGA